MQARDLSLEPMFLPQTFVRVSIIQNQNRFLYDQFPSHFMDNSTYNGNYIPTFATYEVALPWIFPQP